MERLYVTRWIILERDNFTCQYCGQHAPNVILHIDHRIPVAAGGSHDESNLVTACSACNFGKSDSLKAKPRKRRNTSVLPDRIAEYLAEYGGSSASVMAKALGTDRANICRIVRSNPRFVEAHRRGKSVLYDLAPPV